jgi:cation diffusion facilitator family transporter
VEDGSKKVVVVALVANLVIAGAKFVAAGITGSPALLAEAFHSLADSGNEVLLRVAQVRGGRPSDARHPFGHGREAYFWSVIAAVAVFVGGGLLSVRQGIDELLHPAEATSFAAGYVVLVVAIILDGTSLRQAYRQLQREAADLGRNFGRHFTLTSDPVTRAVFLEDAAAVTGSTAALAGLGLRQATGSAVPDAVAAIFIGLLLGLVAVELTLRNRDFLVGEQAPEEVKSRISGVVAEQPGIVAVNELLVTFVGPRRLWVVCRVDIDDGLRGDEVEQLVRDTEQALCDASEAVVRADIVTVGRLSSRAATGDRG